MIARYTRPEIGAIWTDEARFTAMRDVEVAAAEALDGPTPEDLDAIRARDLHGRGDRRAREDPDHDTAAFVDVLAASAGPAGRWIHYGLTSSDVVDTGLALQLKRAGALLVPGARALATSCGTKALEHADTLCVGRTHGVHAEPTSFGLKLAGYAMESHRNADRLERAFGQMTGAISGAVGTFATLGPDYEDAGDGEARARAPSRSRPRSSRATATPSCCRRSRSPAPGWSASRPRSGTCSAPRCARSRSRSARARRARSAMPHKRNPVVCERICGLARVLRGNAQVAVENVALWHERDITHSVAERIILPDSTILLDQLLHLARRVVNGMTVHADRMLANLEITSGALFSQRVLLALVERGHAARRRLPDRPAARPAGVGHADAAAYPARAGRRRASTSTRSSTTATTCATCPRCWRAWR